MNGLLTTLMVAVNITQSTPLTSKWETDYGTALHSAQIAERPLVVLLENPHDPDQSVGKEVLENSHVRPELLDKFQLCRVDVTTKTGKLVAKAFGAEQFPYTAISDQKCRKIVYRHAGRPTAGTWIAVLAARAPRPNSRSRLLQDSTVFSQEDCFS